MRVRLEKDGVTVSLSGEPLARGGEAVVWPLPDHPTLLAKVYHDPTPENADKLAAMIANPPDDPTAKQGHTSIAWPTQRLFDADAEGRCVGFVMPRVDKVRSLFDVYNPKSRSQTWPLFHYGYLLRTARNLAIAVRALHARGYVLGDLNESNVLVNAQTLVTVVDTDSFQVRAGERVFRCIVGKPEYAAPEIQGADFKQIDRLPEQDHFALAVLIFQLLMQGSHPFAGRFTGEGEPESLARRIAAGHWPYAKKRKGPFQPNPTAPPFVVAPPQVRELMRQCFEAGHERPGLRPDAAEWQKALAEADAELTECVANGQHHFHKSLDACPWCELAHKQGRDPFPAKGKGRNGAEKSGAHKAAPTAVSAPKRRTPADGRPTTPPANFPRIDDSALFSRPHDHRGAPPPSFLSTPWPWVIGGAAVGLLVLVGAAVAVAAMVFRPSAPTPVVFATPSGGPAVAKPRSPARMPGGDAGAGNMGGAGPDGPAGPGGPGGAGGAPAPDPGGAPPAGPPTPAAAPRQTPNVLQPDQSASAVVRFPLPSLVFSKDLQFVMVLKGVFDGGAPGPAGRGRPPGFGPPDPGRRGEAFNPNAFKSGLTNLKGSKRGVLVDRNNPNPDRLENDFDTDWVRLEGNTEVSGPGLARQAYPVRGVEITAAFPYKKEVEEFQKKLGLRSPADVFLEQAGATKDGLSLAAFRFLGVVVQRRELDAAGKPVGDGDGWKPLDVEGDYKALLALDGRRTQEDAPELGVLEFPGLVMKKLATFGDRREPPVDAYPDVESNLTKLTETLRNIRNVPADEVARPGPSQEPGSAFDPDADDPVDALPPGGLFPGGPGAGAPPGGLRPPFGGPPGGAPPFGGPPGAAPPGGADLVVPDHCLIRAFDFTVEPGKTYEYRLQVRMANPNFGRRDVAAAADAETKELASKDDWYVLPDKLATPPELFVYAVEQKDLDARDDRDKDPARPKEPKLPVQPVKRDSQTVLQIHKWVDFLGVKGRTELPVGDWVIAERVVATRGELIGRQRVEVPYWRTAQDQFIMATDQPPRPAGKKVPATAEIPFFREDPSGEKDTILIDFSGGDVTHTRTHPRSSEAEAPAAELPISDKAPVEVLLLTADGKVLVHSSALDAIDPDRVKRLENVRVWIDGVKKMQGGKQGGKDDKFFPDRPFGP